MRERTQAAIFLAAWLAAMATVLAALGVVIPEPPGGPSEILTATLAIEGSGWRIAYEAATKNGTVFLLMQEASANLAFEIDYIEYGWPYYDVLVTSINGTRSGDVAGHFWQYCTNGVYAARGALHQEVRDGDAILWVYAPMGGGELCH